MGYLPVPRLQCLGSPVETLVPRPRPFAVRTLKTKVRTKEYGDARLTRGKSWTRGEGCTCGTKRDGLLDVSRRDQTKPRDTST